MIEFHQKTQMTTHRFNMAIWALLGMAMGAMPLLAVTIPVANSSFESNSTLSYATVIYQQNFTGGNTPIVGTTSTTGGGTWAGANLINLDGNSTAGDGAISLPFTPQSGFVYELTATINVTGANGTWLGVGFLETNSLYGFFGAKTTPTALRTADWQIWPQAFNANVLTSNEVLVRLDTTEALWKTAMYQGGDQIGSTYTYMDGNPTINYVGFVSTGDAVRNVSAFQLKSATPSSRAPERKEFMIMPWNMMDPNNPALGYFNNPAQFEIMKDCGFNTAPLMVPSLLASCQQAGLKGWLIDPGLQTLLDNYLFDGVVPTDPQIEEAVEAMVNTYDANPAVFGYFVWDEPGGSWFPKIAKVVAEIRKRSTKPWYVNLLPTYASAMTQLQSESYDAYVTNFITTVQPQFLSYDHYALMADGTMRTGYWENMNRFYSIARQRDLPVIPIIQSVGQSVWQSVNGVDTLVPYYRITSEADLRFQVFTHLAYGAKGMQYFTYFTPVLDGSYQGGPIDPSGNKTAAWNAMQNVNRRLKILGPALLGLRWEKSYHFGNLPAEYGVTGHVTDSLVQDVRNPDDTTPDVLVGELKDSSGVDYLMVVNKSLTNTITPNITFKSTPQTVLEYGRTGGTLEAWGGRSRSLAPGEGMLLLVNPGADWNLADADDDGLSNLLEYGLNSDLYSADSRAGLAPALDGGSLKVTFNRINDPRLIYSLQASDDLVSWLTIWSSTGEQNIKGPVTVTDNGGTENTKRFLRMTIASP